VNQMTSTLHQGQDCLVSKKGCPAHASQMCVDGRKRMTSFHRCFFFLLILVLSASPVMAKKKDHEARGDKAFAEGNFKKASKEYKKAVKKKPGDVSLRFKLGKAYLKKGDVDKALAEFIRVSNMDPNHEGAFQQLGDYFWVKKKPDKAAKAYESLVRINPESARYHFQLAKVLDSLHRDDKALFHFFKTILLNVSIEEAYPYLFKLLKRKLIQNPRDADTHMVLGRVYKMHGDLGEARAQFALVVQMEPQAKDGWTALHEVCKKLQDCQGEVMALKGLHEFSPKDIGLLDQLLQTAHRCEMWDVKKQYLEKRLKLLPDDPATYAQLGRLYQKEGNRSQVYFFFQKYLERRPDGPDAVEMREWCQNEELDRPEIVNQYRAFNLFQEGNAAFRNGNFERSMSLFQRARNIFSGFPQVHFYMGQALEELDRRGESLFAYKEAIKLDPNNAEYWFFLGNALNGQKMFGDAAVCFQKVQEADPENRLGYTLRAQKILQSYAEQGIIKRKRILDKGWQRP